MTVQSAVPALFVAVTVMVPEPAAGRGAAQDAGGGVEAQAAGGVRSPRRSDRERRPPPGR